MQNKKTYKALKNWGRALLLALVFSLLIKGFVLESFIMGSFKMDKTVLKGDIIFVEKTSFGPRLTITPLSLPFFSGLYSKAISLPYKRLFNKTPLKQNHIIAFNNPSQTNVPIDKATILLKRCVATPGDTIAVIKKKVYVNNIEFVEPHNLQHNYRVVTNENYVEREFRFKYQINEGVKVSEIGIFEYAIENRLLDSVKAEKGLRYVRDLTDFPGENTQNIFPHSKNYTFTKDFFGPLLVPKKGQIITLNSRNFDLYKAIILGYEQNSVELQNNQMYINGVKTNTYKVKYNYYFVLDDNRDNADDSRYWGFLPESHIIGRAFFRWFSYNDAENSVRWNRCFEPIN